MKLSTHIIAVVTLTLLAFTMQAQQQAAPSKYVVFFRDKNNSPYSLSNPEQYLSQRALDRRARFNIAIDERDLPINPQYITGVQNAGVVILNKQKWLNSITIWVPDTAVLQQISALPYVQSINTIALRKKK